MNETIRTFIKCKWNPKSKQSAVEAYNKFVKKHNRQPTLCADVSKVDTKRMDEHMIKRNYDEVKDGGIWLPHFTPEGLVIDNA